MFTDIINNKVLKWNEKEGVSDYIYPSGNTGYAPNSGEALLGANALNFDSNGNLILCQMGDRRVSIIKNSSTTNPVFETLVDNFQGKRLNSPNDIIISKDGFYYFSDPAFGFFNLETFQFVESELKDLNFSDYWKGKFPKNLAPTYENRSILKDAKYMIDMSIIKGDGGGTQYTFLEAIHQDTLLILHNDWINAGTTFKSGYNCIGISTPEELAEFIEKGLSETELNNLTLIHI